MADDNHVICIHPDDDAIEYEMNRELDRQERRMIDQRVKWLQEQRRRRGWV